MITQKLVDILNVIFHVDRFEWT